MKIANRLIWILVFVLGALVAVREILTLDNGSWMPVFLALSFHSAFCAIGYSVVDWLVSGSFQPLKLSV